MNQHVTVTGKVMLMKEAENGYINSRGETLKKQDLVLSDCGSSCQGVVREKDVGVLKVDCSYKLKNVTVRSFIGRKYISSDNSTIQELGDIGEVAAAEDVCENQAV